MQGDRHCLGCLHLQTIAPHFLRGGRSVFCQPRTKQREYLFHPISWSSCATFKLLTHVTSFSKHHNFPLIKVEDPPIKHGTHKSPKVSYTVRAVSVLFVISHCQTQLGGLPVSCSFPFGRQTNDCLDCEGLGLTQLPPMLLPSSFLFRNPRFVATPSVIVQRGPNKKQFPVFFLQGGYTGNNDFGEGAVFHLGGRDIFFLLGAGFSWHDCQQTPIPQKMFSLLLPSSTQKPATRRVPSLQQSWKLTGGFWETTHFPERR